MVPKGFDQALWFPPRFYRDGSVRRRYSGKSSNMQMADGRRRPRPKGKRERKECK
jgi:hypothetical protein